MDDQTGYAPTMPAERVDRLRRWHEDAYRAAKAEGATEQTFDYLGRTIGTATSSARWTVSST